MSILLISAVFPPEPIVSAQISKDLAIALSNKYQVCVLCPKPSRPAGMIFHNNDHLELPFNKTQIQSFVYPKSGILGRMLESLSFGKKCVQYIKARKTDITLIYVNTWPIFAQYFAVRSSLKYRIPVIIHVQDIYPESLANKVPVLRSFINLLLLPIDKHILQNASRIIAISDKMKHYLASTRKLDPNKIYVVPNWQDETLLCETQLRVTHRYPFTFMYLGNIGPVAGVDLLIDTFIQTKMKNCRLIIAGSGALKKDLETKVSDFGFTSIEFWEVPDGKVSEIQAQADIMLLPIIKGAASSSVPSKLIAYMFSAKPVLSSVDLNSDTAEVIRTSGCGWIVEPSNASALSLMMKKVTSIPEKELKQLGMLGRNYALENFSKRANLPKLVQVIENVPVK